MKVDGGAFPISLVFLSGGSGRRFGSPVPKQYLSVCDKPVALHSFDLFLSMSEFQEYVVVCAKEWTFLFTEAAKKHQKEKKLRFALPGERRQDSVWNGIVHMSSESLVCIHDGARPLVGADEVQKVIRQASLCGAAALGVKVKSTIKLCDEDRWIKKTLDRASLFEIHTPQVILLSWLREGFQYAREHQITVTDDLSLIELVNKPAKIVEGKYSNIKITTQEDLKVVEFLRCTATS